MGYVYILPWVIGFLFFQAFPMIFSFIISFTRWDIIGAISEVRPAKYDGNANILGNYLNLLFNDPRFLKAISNTFLYIFVSNGAGIVLSLFLAALLYEKIPGRNAFKSILFMPNLVLPVAFGLAMIPVFNSDRAGLVNLFIGLFGVKPVSWLEDPAVAVWVMIISNLWFIGACTVIFLAGIANQPRSVYEAAEIDGAGWWRRFFHITVPLLAPVIFFQVIMGLISGLQIFDIPAALSEIGGNVTASMGKQNGLASLVFYLYISAFRYWKMGYASAIGWFIFLFGLILTLVVMTYMRRSKYSMGEK
jgi:multiple sugar transport system permease protein